MKNIFAPIFLVSLLLLYIGHHLKNIEWIIIHPIIAVSFFSAIGLFIRKKFKLSYIFIILSFGLLITAQFLKEKDEFYQITQSTVPGKEYITIYGKLESFPEIGPGHSYLYIESDCLEYHRKKIFKKFSVRIKVKGNLQHLFRGDHIIVNARIYKNRFNRNFFPNSMEDYVLYKKIHFNGYCKSAQMVTLEEEGSPVWKIIGKWRNKIRGVIEKKYANANTNSGGELNKKGVFLQAILLGERGKLNNPQKEQLLSAGVYHFLAISGAHIGIIAIFSLVFLKFLKISSRKRYILTALLLILFLILSGFKISAERAVLMAILIFIARILYLDIDIFNIISLCGLIILIRNPAQFLDAGFILTFTLTAAIAAGRSIFLPLLEKLKKLPRSIKEILSANFSASIAALPLSLFFFKRYSLAGFFAGLLLLPFTAIITALGILLIPLAPLSPTLSHILLTIIDIPLTLFFYIVELFSEAAGFFNIFRASPPVLLVLVVLIAFFLLSVSRSNTHKILLSLIILVGISYMSINIFFYEPGNLEVFFLDVGQGDSEVVVFPGGDALLIDGGGTYYSDFQVGQKIVLPFILQKKIKIKWVAVSHFHPDHARGIAEIIHIIKPEELWISSEARKDFFYNRLIRVIPGSVKIKKLHAPFNYKIGNCTVEFLYPRQFIIGNRSHNNHSQVIKISDHHHSFLFTGDIEKEVENHLVEVGCSKLRATVIKVPHHGSRTSSTLDFLKCVNPELAIFSYAYNNRFNFPHEGVIQNYKSQRIKYLSTARSGGIKIISRPSSIEMETSR